MIPPHNIEAEQVVIGSMLISPEDVAVAINDLSAEAFYSPKHAIVFNACAELSTAPSRRTWLPLLRTCLQMGK